MVSITGIAEAIALFSQMGKVYHDKYNTDIAQDPKSEVGKIAKKILAFLTAERAGSSTIYIRIAAKM
jgi:hypothetical protein